MTYETIARLGRGGMGVVDLARDAQGNRVALKRITLTGSAGEILRARQRLLREAEVLRRLQHPNVVRLIDVLDEGDEIVLVMSYLMGGSLNERVAQHGPAPADEVERQARRLFGALARAHGNGVVHRDIKPANILFDDRGEPCLVDFGVAQTWDQTHGLTVAGMVVGTPGFMPPEQARGEQATAASDVFSLGATLLFAATGDGPFGVGDPALLMVRAAGGRVEKVPKTLPASLRRLLRATLDPRPDRRPTAASLVGAPGFMAAVPRPQSRVSWAVVSGVAAATALFLGTLVVADSNDDAEGAGDGGTLGDGAPSEPILPDDCDDRPYQPCGQAEPAPFTDGRQCVDDHADYDGDPINGCEAAPDRADGTALVLPDDQILATIVPSDDTDSYAIVASEADPVDCTIPLDIAVDPPRAMDVLVEVHGDGIRPDDAIGTSSAPAVVTVDEPCGRDGTLAEDLRVTVSPAGNNRVDAPYLLEVKSDA